MMPAPSSDCIFSNSAPRVKFHFLVLVTGKGEKKFLGELFEWLNRHPENLTCKFELEKIEQHRPSTSSKKHKKRIVGQGKSIPNKLTVAVSLKTRNYLGDKNISCSYVILIDDLENTINTDNTLIQPIFQLYRDAIDQHITSEEKDRASVHFFVSMLEAYYFAYADATNKVLKLNLQDYKGNVETIRHPKNDLIALVRNNRPKGSKGFDEIDDGEEILKKLNLEHVLSNPDTCRALRTLFKWCWQAIGQPVSDKYQCLNGKTWEITDHQLYSNES